MNPLIIDDDRRQFIKDSVLATLDVECDGRGWVDTDLPALFTAIDQHIDRVNARRKLLENLTSRSGVPGL